VTFTFLISIWQREEKTINPFIVFCDVVHFSDDIREIYCNEFLLAFSLIIETRVYLHKHTLYLEKVIPFTLKDKRDVSPITFQIP
jgi:hypothetical protein